jgi:hypothetical protein
LCGFSPPHFASPGLAAQALIRAGKTSYTAERYAQFALTFIQKFDKIGLNNEESIFLHNFFNDFSH